MTTSQPSTRPSPAAARPGWVVLVVVVGVALNLRPAIAAVPPVLDAIQRDLGLSATAAGLLTALPVVCMGAFAPVGAALARRVGQEAAVACALTLVTAGTLARGLDASAAALYGGTLLSGIGIALGGALLPRVVKAWFPSRPGAVTGLYTAGLVTGAMLASAATVPLMDALSIGWPAAVAAWGLPAAAALAAWVPVTRRLRTAAEAAPGPVRLPWGSGVAWRVTLYMGSQSLLYYAALTWLSPLYLDAGWSADRAGLLLGLFSFTQIFSALAVPALADRTGDHRPWVALCVGATTAMLAALGLAPTAAPWVWAAVLGLGVGGMFALALTLLVKLASSPAAAARLSGMALLVGYLLAATGPVLAGALYDAAGSYRAPFLALAGIGVATLALGVSVRPSDRV
ncbi:MAG TPA: MFS transporter [Actinomycetes bacterium]|nr:MFS transporter [Actinomycetes bacterium]